MNNRSWNFWKKKKKEKRRITKREKSQDPCNFNGPLFLEERSSNGCRKWRERGRGAWNRREENEPRDFTWV